MDILNHLIKEFNNKAFTLIKKDLKEKIIKDFLKNHSNNYGNITIDENTLIDKISNLNQLKKDYKIYFSKKIKDELIAGNREYWNKVIKGYGEYLRNILKSKKFQQDKINSEIGKEIKSLNDKIKKTINNDDKKKRLLKERNNLFKAFNSDISGIWIEKYQEEILFKFYNKLYLGNSQLTTQEKDKIIKENNFQEDASVKLETYEPTLCNILTSFTNILVNEIAPNTIKKMISDIRKGNFEVSYQNPSSYDKDDKKKKVEPLDNIEDEKGIDPSADTEESMNNENILKKMKYNHKYENVSDEKKFLFDKSCEKYLFEKVFDLKDDLNDLYEEWISISGDKTLTLRKFRDTYYGNIYPYRMRKLLLIKIYEEVREIEINNHEMKELLKLWIDKHFYEIKPIKTDNSSLEDIDNDLYEDFQNKLIEKKGSIVGKYFQIINDFNKKVNKEILKSSKNNPIRNIKEFFKI